MSEGSPGGVVATTTLPECMCLRITAMLCMWDPRFYPAAVLLLTLVYLSGYVSARHTVRASRHPALPTKLSQADSVPALPSASYPEMTV